MKKLALLICIIMALFLLIGCGAVDKAMEKGMESKIEKETGQEADVDIDTGKGEMEIKTEVDGKKVDIKGTQGSDDWCSVGTKWEMSSDEAQAKMVIQGIVESGEYKGYCHVKYDIEAQDGVGNIDFYFTEDGEGVQVMDINGQKIEQKWSTPPKE